MQDLQQFDFTILGAPRTKKNHGRRKYSFALRRTLNVASEAYEAWESIAWQAIPSIRRAAELAGVELPIAARLNCAAQFYRDGRTEGDAVGYYQGLADWLQKVRVVLNDKQIAQWDGARIFQDVARPRIEVRLIWLPDLPKAAPRARRKGDRRV